VRTIVALLVVIASFAIAVGLRSLEPDVRINCRSIVEQPLDCTDTRRSAWIDGAGALVVIVGVAGAAAIIVRGRRRRTAA
jgi:hypothetical protein